MNVSCFLVRAVSLFGTAAMLAACTTSDDRAGGSSAMLPGLSAAAKTSEHVLYNFTGGNDGGNAATGLILDSGGDLYGTTVVGGAYTCGTVFKLTPRATPPWPESVVYPFTCLSDGKNPHGGVSFDSSGNLDGTTVSGGAGPSCGSYGCGVVFQVTPSTENVLHDFAGGRDGFGPGGGVTFDAAGNLYGTTPDGGTRSQGVVYEITPQRRERIVHAFTGGSDGGVGSLGLLLLQSGSLFGVTEEGGAHGAGTAFRLSRSGGRWRLATLYAFKGTPDAASPYGGLVTDAAGNLFGTTYYGGANGVGAVFELKRKDKGYHERVLYSFKGGNDGSSPTSTLVFEGASLYGTASAGGGSCGCGTIFEVNATSGAETTLHAFGTGADGAYPYYGLTKGSKGILYGTTVAGGSFGQGTVFELKP